MVSNSDLWAGQQREVLQKDPAGGAAAPAQEPSAVPVPPGTSAASGLVGLSLQWEHWCRCGFQGSEILVV